MNANENVKADIPGHLRLSAEIEQSTAPDIELLDPSSARSSKSIVHMTSAHDAYDVRILLKECYSLAAAGYDTTLIAPHNQDEMTNGVRIHAVKMPGNGRLGRFLVTSMRVLCAAISRRADLYHFHDPDLIPAGIILRLTGAKVIYDVHEDVPRQIIQKTWIPKWQRAPLAAVMKALEWTCAKFFFSGIVSVVRDIADRFPPDKTVIAHNYPIVENLAPIRSTAYSERAHTCLYAGGIASQRGTIETVNAMTLVETENANLSIAGKVYHPQVLTQAEKLPGWQKVKFHGWQTQEDMHALMHEARIGILTEHPSPNHLVALPVKLFEYMRASLPIVVSDVPLWASIVEEHRCGIVVDPLDPDAIASAIDWMFENPEEAEAMGRRGRQAVVNVYNWKAEERVLIAFYDKLLRPARESVRNG